MDTIFEGRKQWSARAPAKVPLTEEEYLIAATVGMHRRLAHIHKDPTPGKPRYVSYDHDVYGAVAEFAVAKFFNVHWSGMLGDPKMPDVGYWLEVRKVDAHFKRLLCLHDEDHDDRPYLLVRVERRLCTIMGWTWGRDGKAREKKPMPNSREDMPCYQIEPRELNHDLAALHIMLADESMREAMPIAGAA